MATSFILNKYLVNALKYKICRYFKSLARRIRCVRYLSTHRSLIVISSQEIMELISLYMSFSMPTCLFSLSPLFVSFSLSRLLLSLSVCVCVCVSVCLSQCVSRCLSLSACLCQPASTVF